MFLADAESFVRAQNIFMYRHYDAHLRDAAKFIYDYAQEYKTLPDVEMVNAKTGAELQSASDIDPKHFDWFLDEFDDLFVKRHFYLMNLMVYLMNLMAFV